MKLGEIVKYRNPFPDEDPNQLYIILEIFEGNIPLAKIQALNTGFSFPPVFKVKLLDLIVSEVKTDDLLGEIVAILKEGKEIVVGKVINVNNDKLFLDLGRVDKGIQTNVKLTIVDQEGNKHSGFLFIPTQ